VNPERTAPETVKGAKRILPASLTLLIPSNARYAAAIRILRQGLHLRHDQIRDADQPVGDTAPVIAVGNMMDSAFLRGLYWCLDDITDRAWPGVGGWALRSVPTPTSRTGATLIVSVSDAADAAAAATALVERVGTDGTIPYLHVVELGAQAHLYHDAARPFLGTPQTPWHETGGAGDWDYMMLIARMGMAAVKTGTGELVTSFIEEVLRFAQVRFFERTRQDPIMIHGFLRHLLVPFAQLEHHPQVSAGQRDQVLAAFLALLRSTEGAANPRLLQDTQHHRVRQNHGTRTALDVFTCGRYLRRVHDLTEADDWMQLAHRFFEPQLASSKPVEDSWGHQWRATLYNTADFALQADIDDYLHGTVFQQAADRALLAHSNLESGPILYLLLAAAVRGDDRYLRLPMRDGEQALIASAVTDLGGDETGRSWVTGRERGEPSHLTGLRVAPLSRLFYDSLEAYPEYLPRNVYRRTVPWEGSFDKISWRRGWDPEDEYLLLDGVSGGSHAYQDANAIVRFTAAGHAWFGGPDYGKWSTASVREHCAVSVVVDGTGPGTESRYAHLLGLSEVSGASLASTELIYPDMAIWRRHILCTEAGWFLCVDEMEALVAGRFLVEARWNVMGDVESSTDALHSKQGQAQLSMRALGHDDSLLQTVVDREGIACQRWTLRSLAELEQSDSLRLLTAWRVSAGARDAGSATPVDIELERTQAGVRVAGIDILFGAATGIEDQGGVWHLPGTQSLRSGSAERFHLVVENPWVPVWQLHGDSDVTAMATSPAMGAIGDAAGVVRLVDASGAQQHRLETGGAVRSLTWLPGGKLAVGGDDATVRLFSSGGEELWSHLIAWQPMSWEYWTRLHCGIVSLVPVDLDGDGQMGIVVGCADRHLYAFSSTGALRWRTACQWGVPTSLAHTTAADGAARVLAGMSQPSIHGWCRVHDGDGHFLYALQREDIVCWSIPSWVRSLRVADVDGDGRDEVITGLDTNHNQLIVYRLDGEILWEADVGSAAVDVDICADTVIVGAACGMVSAFAASAGHRRWLAFLGRPIVGVIARPDRTVALGDDGSLVELDDTGRIQRVAACSRAKGEPVRAISWDNAVLQATAQTVRYFT
jgi:hypothetical protein